MSDTTNTGTTSLDADADDRIDALAREAGTALRREPSPRQLARVHRAKRNRQVGQAVLGCFAVLAIGGGAFLLLDRDDGAELVPAEPPTTPVVTAPPETAPAITTTTAPPTTAVVVPSTAAPATTSPPLATANDASSPTPAVVYVVAGERRRPAGRRPRHRARWSLPNPRDHQRYARRLGRHRSARARACSAVAYRLDAGRPSRTRVRPVPGVGRREPRIAELALPDLASFLAVSDDGRHVITVSTPDCPPRWPRSTRQPASPSEIGIFDADDPAEPGITMEAGPDGRALLHR